MSTITRTQSLSEHHKDADTPEKFHRLSRASSIDKIRLLNNYIYSKHYYIFPALLNWLKTSNNGLQKIGKNTINFYRFALINSIIYRAFHLNADATKAQLQDCIFYTKTVILPNIVDLFVSFYDRCVESHLLRRLGVIALGAFVVAEFFMCFYFLLRSVLPSGLVFLIVCVALIVILLCKSLRLEYVYLNKKHK